jgi:hypothetical protein
MPEGEGRLTFASMSLLMRRRPLLRAAAIGGGAYYEGKRRIDAQERENAERARLHCLEPSIKSSKRGSRREH